eukprot:TRINITY_DN3481_c0_g1_i5.p1 TRINITY_DN3481_c0_g1~~TRINITY_DN3481_c0_g1_i5.p1  ORF type:complete len:121 (+),score=0.67 TRINITY_DN3481_c0_g1_i5:162-524(+)
MATTDDWSYSSDASPAKSLSVHKPRSRESLANVRIVKKDTVYVIGLSPSIAKPEVRLWRTVAAEEGEVHGTVRERGEGGCEHDQTIRPASKRSSLLLRLHHIHLPQRSFNSHFGLIGFIR